MADDQEPRRFKDKFVKKRDRNWDQRKDRRLDRIHDDPATFARDDEEDDLLFELELRLGYRHARARTSSRGLRHLGVG
jgi:hypothetical protein